MKTRRFPNHFINLPLLRGIDWGKLIHKENINENSDSETINLFII